MSRISRCAKKSIDAEYLHIEHGLAAFEERDKSKINCRDTRKITGSIYLDRDLQSEFPDDNRWDYIVGYGSADNEKVWFIEVHPAISSEVEIMVEKTCWLKNWIEHRAVEFKKINSGMFWVASGKVHIQKHVALLKQLSKLGVKNKFPVERLTIG